MHHNFIQDIRLARSLLQPHHALPFQTINYVGYDNQQTHHGFENHGVIPPTPQILVKYTRRVTVIGILTSLAYFIALIVIAHLITVLQD